jgi:hypothetical protein
VIPHRRFFHWQIYFAPQLPALFRHLNFQKGPQQLIFSFRLRTILVSASLLFDPKLLHKPNAFFRAICIFFLTFSLRLWQNSVGKIFMRKGGDGNREMAIFSILCNQTSFRAKALSHEKKPLVYRSCAGNLQVAIYGDWFIKGCAGQVASLGQFFCHLVHFVRKGSRLQERERTEMARWWEEKCAFRRKWLVVFCKNAPVCESLCFFGYEIRVVSNHVVL